MPVPVRPIRPVPAPSVRPWAGTRLGAPGEQVGERWLAGPGSVVRAADGTETTLDALAARMGEALVGSAGMARYGARFPLLAKLIDAADWLSLQVHPDDGLAIELFGADAVGKAEAWVVVEASDGARLITGPSPGVDEDRLRAAIAAGTAGRAHCEARSATAGDVLLIRPGTLHAIGGGTFLYELQQPSDLTFRVSDWGRTGRELHIEASLRALRADLHAEQRGAAFRIEGDAVTIDQLRLELATPATGARRRPAGRSPEVVTALRGTLRLEGDGWSETLATYDTIVVPAAVPAYAIRGADDAIAAVGTVP